MHCELMTETTPKPSFHFSDEEIRVLVSHFTRRDYNQFAVIVINKAFTDVPEEVKEKWVLVIMSEMDKVLGAQGKAPNIKPEQIPAFVSFLAEGQYNMLRGLYKKGNFGDM